MPITSPVERISGPRMMSTPGNLLNGKTLSLTEKCVGTTSSIQAQLVERLADHDQRRRSRASGTPVALETNGTVRLARGLTSRT